MSKPTVQTFQPSSENQVDEYLYQTPIDGLIYIEHKRFDDDRGFYAELSRVPELEQLTGISFCVQQFNLSRSKQHVARGFHAENWNKLLSVVQGECFCAWVDIRPESNTFGQVVTMTVGPETSHFGSVFVQAGIANSFCVLSQELDYLYSVDALYAERDASQDVAISLFDPDLGVEWPIDQSNMIISERDVLAVSLREKFPEKF